jgi:thiamine biosynthesis lipoprotein
MVIDEYQIMETTEVPECRTASINYSPLFERTMRLIALLTGTALLLTACGSEPPVHRDSRPLMGTVVEISVEHPDREKAQASVEAAFREMNRLSDMMNHYNPASVVSAINDGAGKKDVPVPPELREVLAMAQALSQRTDGAFDITIGSLKGWRFNPDDPRTPAAGDIDRQKALINYRDVLVDEDKGTARLRRAGQRIDLGGIAKLYILRAGMNTLAAQGIERALVNGGGDVVARAHAQGKPWRVGIRDPRKSEALLGVLEVRNGFVVSSGDYERYFIKDGKRYHHILDPRTGYPVDGPQHVTLVSEKIEEVNGVSTSIMVLGADLGRLLIERTKGLDGLIVDRDGTRWVSAGLEERLKPAPAKTPAGAGS